MQTQITRVIVLPSVIIGFLRRREPGESGRCYSFAALIADRVSSAAEIKEKSMQKVTNIVLVHGA
jgi:hypothetical protein